MRFVAVGTAIQLVLSAAHAAVPTFFYFLPLGGSPMAEAGIVLSISLAIDIIVSLIWNRPNG